MHVRRRNGTTLTSASNGCPLALFCAPDTTVHMLAGEAAGTRCLDFSSDGRLLVSPEPTCSPLGGGGQRGVVLFGGRRCAACHLAQ